MTLNSKGEIHSFQENLDIIKALNILQKKVKTVHQCPSSIIEFVKHLNDNIPTVTNLDNNNHPNTNQQVDQFSQSTESNAIITANENPVRNQNQSNHSKYSYLNDYHSSSLNTKQGVYPNWANLENGNYNENVQSNSSGDNYEQEHVSYEELSSPFVEEDKSFDVFNNDDETDDDIDFNEDFFKEF
ncbi:hypothetical protein TRFO_31951 [Tritrichomonas foetus]|uniref:Uncharacterized protein n=1 Tax=Tritrichomonas foetus TaxID=1144522 RepID=A0A1J4JUS8_9EUKA|nr:hypothetical protein TRFO_31951 [Tritrichomonas foetus]|eukprot:OHT01276.1 hypothetical protein TRFO_31951 [Tritrichomonas foetus]